MRNELGDVRRSQVITTHGPGSIVDFRAGGYGGAGISVVAAGLEEWDRWAPPPGLGHQAHAAAGRKFSWLARRHGAY
jgi:hypothetical protein